MSNDSSTGGYLSPLSTGGELNDAALTDFLQTVVVGITGLSGSLVRPRWQEEPPNRPGPLTDWAGVAVVARRPDKFPYTTHRLGFDETYRQEILEVLCTFYGPNRENNAELLSLGLQVEQNLEQMNLAGYGLVEVDDPISTADLVHEQYVLRLDLGFKLRRVQIYTYPVLEVAAAQGTVQPSTGPNQAFNSNLHTVVKAPMFAWDLVTEFHNGWDNGNWK